MILFDLHSNTIKGTIIPNSLEMMKQTQWAYLVSTKPKSRPSLGASRASAPKDTWHRDRETRGIVHGRGYVQDESTGGEVRKWKCEPGFQDTLMN